MITIFNLRGIFGSTSHLLGYLGEGAGLKYKIWSTFQNYEKKIKTTILLQIGILTKMQTCIYHQIFKLVFSRVDIII